MGAFGFDPRREGHDGKRDLVRGAVGPNLVAWRRAISDHCVDVQGRADAGRIADRAGSFPPRNNAGDTIPLGRDRTLSVTEVRGPDEPDGDPVLVVSPVRNGH